MKKIIFLMIGGAMLFLSSCMKIDNFSAPNAQISGVVRDSLTGKNLIMDNNDWQIRVWEKSWTASVAQSQSLAVKYDGTYNNTKWFAGTYDMLPYGGPFWPVRDTVKNVKIGTATTQDFKVVSYLQILNFTATLGSTPNDSLLTLTFNVKAPILSRYGITLPNIVELKPFVSMNTFCGNSNYINIGDYNNKKITLNKSWSSWSSSWVPAGGDTSPIQTISNLPLRRHRTYYVRVGANVNDANKKYNYSPIVKVVVP